MKTEDVYHVYPRNDGKWCVRIFSGQESQHSRKALAALFAKQAAANGKRDGRVIFYRADGSIEVERFFNSPLSAKERELNTVRRTLTTPSSN